MPDAGGEELGAVKARARKDASENTALNSTPNGSKITWQLSTKPFKPRMNDAMKSKNAPIVNLPNAAL
jgi:hypothetical protein